MTKKRERDGREDNAPTTAVGDDATERHLVKARALLREARSRLSSRDDGTADSNGSEQLIGDDAEDSHD